MAQCEDILDIDTMGAQVLEQCELEVGHFGDHENKTANHSRGYTWHNEAPSAYDPFRNIPDLSIHSPYSSVQCPKCGAKVDQSCKMETHSSLSFHRERMKAVSPILR